jgi:hypothetical protein
MLSMLCGGFVTASESAGFGATGGSRTMGTRWAVANLLYLLYKTVRQRISPPRDPHSGLVCRSGSGPCGSSALSPNATTTDAFVPHFEAAPKDVDSPEAALLAMKLSLETYSADVNPFRARSNSLFISAKNLYSHRVGILIHITPEQLFTCPGIRRLASLPRTVGADGNPAPGLARRVEGEGFPVPGPELVRNRSIRHGHREADNVVKSPESG